MANAVVLQNNKVVKSSNFGAINSIAFNFNGTVQEFTYSNKRYYSISDFVTKEFLDYVEKEAFNELVVKEKNKEGENYNGVDKKLWVNIIFKDYDNLIPAEIGDIILGMIKDSTGLCYNYHTWIFNGLPYSGPNNPIYYANSPYLNETGTNCVVFAAGTVAKDFFDTYKNTTFVDTNQTDKRLIGEIATLLKEAGEKTATAFIGFTVSNSVTNDFIFYDNNNNGLFRKQLLEYKRGLIIWIQLLKKYSSEISSMSYDEKLFISLNYMYRHNLLAALSVDQRISMLKILVQKQRLTNWRFIGPKIGFVHTEDFALYILRSVTTLSDATEFLEKLVSTSVIESELKDNQGTVISENYTTLYKLLFYRMDDYGGDDNFTEFVKQLERIVKLKNTISEPDPVYTLAQILQYTNKQFFWRESGPKLGRISYQVKSTETKIIIKETICLKSELFPIYTTQGTVGASFNSITGYREDCVQSETRTFELNHFDPIFIYFYDNPSFVDLSESPDASYVGKPRITFAGFFQYIAEKEDSARVEFILNTTIFAISLAFGIGELMAAVRTINFARAFLGVGMITSDTALYLTTRLEFRNYIIDTYGFTEGTTILSNMTILSTISSLGFNLTAGSGILKVYSREEGLKLVGTGEAILKDSNALATMLPNEIVALEEAIKKVKNELYAIRNVPEAVNTITRTKATVIFNKFPELKNELGILTETARFRFYDDFANISEEFVKNLDKTPDFIQYWDNLSESQKISFKIDKFVKYEAWYQVSTETKALNRFNLGIIDVDTGLPFRLSECRTWVDLEIQSKGSFQAKPFGKIGDVLANTGNFNETSLVGKTIDFWGLPDGTLTVYYQGSKRTKQIRKLLNSVDDHFLKFFNSTEFPGESLGVFVMDLRYFNQDEAIKTLIFNKINDPNYIFKSFRDNPNYFILLNQ